MNDLEQYFHQNDDKLIHKWKHYFDIYDNHFSRFRNTQVNIVEFGVSQGGSLQMWKNYFGEKAKIFGVDINPHCKELEEERVKIFIGDQQDKNFLTQLKNEIPKIDILIDDGGHTMKQQINTFEILFDSIDENGVYLCEDVHTSYWPNYGGGYKKRGSFIEYSKNFVDALHAWHSKEPGKFEVSDFTRSAHSVHFYDSIVVIEKRKMQEPYSIKVGTPTVPKFQPERTFIERVQNRIRTLKG